MGPSVGIYMAFFVIKNYPPIERPSKGHFSVEGLQKLKIPSLYRIFLCIKDHLRPSLSRTPSKDLFFIGGL